MKRISDMEKTDSSDAANADKTIAERKQALEETKHSDEYLLKLKELDQNMAISKMEDSTKRSIAKSKPIIKK